MPSSVRVGSYEFDRAAYGQRDAAALLGDVTRQHVAKMVRDGDIRAVRLGRRVLIPATEIARLLGEDGE
jgi:excisionase family DNA binding protein